MWLLSSDLLWGCLASGCGSFSQTPPAANTASEPSGDELCLSGQTMQARDGGKRPFQCVQTEAPLGPVAIGSSSLPEGARTNAACHLSRSSMVGTGP